MAEIKTQPDLAIVVAKSLAKAQQGTSREKLRTVKLHKAIMRMTLSIGTITRSFVLAKTKYP